LARVASIAHAVKLVTSSKGKGEMGTPKESPNGDLLLMTGNC